MNRPLHAAWSWRLSFVWARLAFARLALAQNALAYAFTLLALTACGFALRLILLHTFPLREDEAIYGYWARAARSDPFFLHVWPDKPPLFIWLLTGTFALLGPSEAAARLPSIFASTLTIPLVAAGARQLWHSPAAGLVAALLITLNPFAVSFASTAYTDSLLVLLGMGALVVALRGRALGAGLLLGAACMTKQQGLFFVPLVLALLVTKSEYAHSAERPLRGDRLPVSSTGSLIVITNFALSCRRHLSALFLPLTWLLLGVAMVVLPILWWDSQRWAVAPSPWALAQSTYAPLTWLAPHAWWPRVTAWAELLWYLGGSATVWVMLAAGVGGAAVLARRNLRVFWLLGWGLAFVVLHIVTTVQVWDRYLLPLAPWLALMASGPLAMVWRVRVPQWGRGLLLALLVVGMVELVPPARAAAHGALPIGGDHGDYAGLTAAMAWVVSQCDDDAQCPAILYHQVLGWHFRFYLYDDLQPVGDTPPRFDLRWFPSTAYLADNAAKSPYPPKYLIVPDWATPRDLALHLAMRRLGLEPRVQMGRFAVMEIVQPPRPLCDWCKSALPLPFDSPTLPLAPQMPQTPQMSTP